MAYVFTPAQFRLDFPAFSDETKYTTAQISFQAALATQQVNPCVWGTLTGAGIELYTAHELALAALSSAGGSGVSGPVSNKAVGSVSVGYDTTQGAEDGAGYWNLSVYGKQYYRLMRMVGVGAIQL